MVSVKNDSGIQTRHIPDLIWYSIFLKLMPREPIIERENSAVHTFHLHSIATLRSGETFRCHRNRDSGRRKLDGSYIESKRRVAVSFLRSRDNTTGACSTHPTLAPNPPPRPFFLKQHLRRLLSAGHRCHHELVVEYRETYE